MEICYKNKQAETIGSKFVKVEYGWKPPRCTACKVFGHIDSNCNVLKKTWNVEKGLMEESRKSANKYTVLEDRIEDESMENDVCRDKNGKSLSMEENIVKENEDVDIFIRWQKEEEMVDMFVNDKKIPNDEELETWARYMCEWYKRKWEAKWKSKCPIVGRCIWIKD